MRAPAHRFPLGSCTSRFRTARTAEDQTRPAPPRAIAGGRTGWRRASPRTARFRTTPIVRAPRQPAPGAPLVAAVRRPPVSAAPDRSADISRAGRPAPPTPSIACHIGIELQSTFACYFNSIVVFRVPSASLAPRCAISIRTRPRNLARRRRLRRRHGLGNAAGGRNRRRRRLHRRNLPSALRRIHRKRVRQQTARASDQHAGQRTLCRSRENDRRSHKNLAAIRTATQPTSPT